MRCHRVRSKGNLGLILSLTACSDTLRRRLLIKAAINLAKRANSGRRRSAPHGSRIVTPRLPAAIEQPHFWWDSWFYFLPTTAFSPDCKSPARQRRHGPPRQRGGVAQEQRFNCHLGVSGLICDGTSVCFHRELCPPRMRLGRRRGEDTTQALRCLALAGRCSGNLGAYREQHPSRGTGRSCCRPSCRRRF